MAKQKTYDELWADYVKVRAQRDELIAAAARVCRLINEGGSEDIEGDVLDILMFNREPGEADERG